MNIETAEVLDLAGQDSAAPLTTLHAADCLRGSGGHQEDLASFCERACVPIDEVVATLEVQDMAGLLRCDLNRGSPHVAFECIMAHSKANSPACVSARQGAP